MFCESYRQSLTDAACAGEALPRELAAHLDACNDCASTFASERALFASIDRSLHAVANPAVPPSLMPRVRAQIESTPTKTFWRLPAIAFATGGLALFAIGWAAFSAWRATIDSPRVKAVVVTPTKEFVVATEPPDMLAPDFPSYAMAARGEHTVVRRVQLRSEPEVLVSSEEMAEFERYVALLRARPLEKAVRASAKVNSDPEIKPLDIAELELDQLAIEPLEDGGSK